MSKRFYKEAKTSFNNLSYSQTVDEFNKIGLAAIKEQTDPYIPININISSVNDSRLMMALLKKAGRIDNIEMTWSYGYEKTENEDLDSIDNLCEQYSLKNKRVLLDVTQIPELMEEAIGYLEQPFGCRH